MTPIKPCYTSHRPLLKLLLIGLLTVGLGWGGTTAANPAMTPLAAEVQAIGQVEALIKRIQNFHDEARNALLETVANPLFAAYLSLDESRHNHHTKDGVLLLTQRQQEIRKDIESLIMERHESFPIGETCLIDRVGQEHMRAMYNKIEAVEHFSDSESSSPFFEPAMNLARGKVILSNPYVSPDAHEWVVAFASPIVLESGERAGFLHMEIPLGFYQNLATVKKTSFTADSPVDKTDSADADEEGRFFIIDLQGHILADSRNNINFKSKRDKETTLTTTLPPEELSEYTPLVSTISQHPVFLATMQAIFKEMSGQRQIKMDNRDYIIVYRPVPERPWILVHLDPVGMKPNELTGWQGSVSLH